MNEIELRKYDVRSHRRRDYNTERKTADKYNHVWEKIAQKFYPNIPFRWATKEEDTNRCTDLVVGAANISLKARKRVNPTPDITCRDIEIDKWYCHEMWQMIIDPRTDRLLRLARIDTELVDASFIRKYGTKQVDNDNPQGGFMWIIPFSKMPIGSIMYLKEYKNGVIL